MKKILFLALVSMLFCGIARAANLNDTTFNPFTGKLDFIGLLTSDCGEGEIPKKTGGVWVCGTDDGGAGSGDVTSVGDCASGACNDGTSDGGTYIRLYDGDSNYGAFVTANLTGNRTYTFPNFDGTMATLAGTETFTNKTMTTATNSVEAVDLVCTNCIGPTEITDLTLGTDTAGNYVASVATTSPLSGGAGGSEGAALTLTIANAAADGSTKGAASFTANDFDATTGNISLDYTNGQAASGSNKGFLTSADWTTFNSKVATTVTLTAGAGLSGGGDLSSNRSFATDSTEASFLSNAANPTISNAGAAAVDTSSGSGGMLRYYDTAERALPAYFTKSFTITSVTSAGDFGAIWKSPFNITIRKISVVQTGATNVVGQLDECDADGANCATIDSSDITATTTNVDDDGTLSNASVDANDWVGWHTTSVSGTNTRATVTFNYTVDPVN